MPSFDILREVPMFKVGDTVKIPVSAVLVTSSIAHGVIIEIVESNSSGVYVYVDATSIDFAEPRRYSAPLESVEKEN